MYINERELQKDINKYLKTFAETYCKQASKEITKMAENAINKFYDDYCPIYYDRTFDLLHNSYSPYYHNNGRNVYGGVRISSERMQDYKNSWSDFSNWKTTSAYDVASWTWKAGYHGYEDGDSRRPIHTFPPIAMVQMEMGNKSFLNRLQKNASSVAEKQQYSFLMF